MAPVFRSALDLGDSGSVSNPYAIAAADCNVPQAGNDGISSLSWSPVANVLVSSNWDGGIRCWEVQEHVGQIRATPRAQVNNENSSPVLATCFSGNGSIVFSGGCDSTVRMWHLGQTSPNNMAQTIGTHDAPVRAVGFIKSKNLVVSGGWDRQLKFWDVRSPTPAATFELPERVYGLNVANDFMVVATAGRQILAYDCSKTPREVRREDSPLKYQTRCVAAFPDSTGYAVGSIEGRVAIQYLHAVPGKTSFAFRCHRRDNAVFAVNCIAFNSQYGTLATVGSDGGISFWDKDNKQRLKVYHPTKRTISCAAFNGQSNWFAYASSYDWSNGSSHVPNGNEIYIHRVADGEIRPIKARTP